MRIAVIDIGSNSIRYLGDGNKRLITTRLADGLRQTGLLGESAMQRSIAALTDFCALSQAENRTPFAYATSAVRDAANREAFLAQINNTLALPVEILSGEAEAQYALLGATHESGGALIDIGGGSTQIICKNFSRSFPIGCVRAKDIVANISENEIQAALAPQLATIIPAHGLPALPRATGVGGTITTLAAIKDGHTQFNPLRLEHITLNKQDVVALIQTLLSMDEARAHHPLLATRHDVILPGAAILKYLMDALHIENLHPSDADGMEGYRTHILQQLDSPD